MSPIEILAILSAAAAGGMRVALPLLVLGLTQTDLWSRVPILDRVQPTIAIGILTAWSILELVITKQLWGQRFLQAIEIIFSPIVGAIMAMGVAQIIKVSPTTPMWAIGIVGGGLSGVLQLVKVGWFYRLRGIPQWASFAQDILCVLLAIFALSAPRTGGAIALLLLWLAVRSSQSWYRWHHHASRKL
jgi:hypothetical protein